MKPGISLNSSMMVGAVTPWRKVATVEPCEGWECRMEAALFAPICRAARHGAIDVCYGGRCGIGRLARHGSNDRRRTTSRRMDSLQRSRPQGGSEPVGADAGEFPVLQQQALP